MNLRQKLRVNDEIVDILKLINVPGQFCDEENIVYMCVPILFEIINGLILIIGLIYGLAEIQM